jgi:hypothetical protein
LRSNCEQVEVYMSAFRLCLFLFFILLDYFIFHNTAELPECLKFDSLDLAGKTKCCRTVINLAIEGPAIARCLWHLYSGTFNPYFAERADKNTAF